MRTITLLSLRTFRLVIVITLLLVASCLAYPPRTSAQSRDLLTVMTRNLYLGADVYQAAQYVPDFNAVSQHLWDQMQKTVFVDRADAFADEVIRVHPDVIGLQEAAQWYCRPERTGRAQVVYDYTQLFIAALARRGAAYEVAHAPSSLPAEHLGFSFPTVPYITTVTDTTVFPPLFGSESVSCGFAIYDVLLVKTARSHDVYRTGASDFVFDYTLVPGFLDMNRGFAWLDMHIGTQTVRVVTTHVEAFFYDNLEPYSIGQTEQFIRDLGTTTSAIVVLGDFNNDPHDPISPQELNTGGRLTASLACPLQSIPLNLATARDDCNTYWMMRHAGYRDAGPDALAATYATWGYADDLAGPAVGRLVESELRGNLPGLTARLDYVFVRNGVEVVDARIIGNEWPLHGWNCTQFSQQANAATTASLLGLPYGAMNACAPSDHAGVVATVRIHDSATQAQTPPYHFANSYTFVAMFLGIATAIWWSVRQRGTPGHIRVHAKHKRRRRHSA